MGPVHGSEPACILPSGGAGLAGGAPSSLMPPCTGWGATNQAHDAAGCLGCLHPWRLHEPLRGPHSSLDPGAELEQGHRVRRWASGRGQVTDWQAPRCAEQAGLFSSSAWAGLLGARSPWAHQKGQEEQPSVRAADLLAPGTSAIHVPFVLGRASACVQCPHCCPASSWVQLCAHKKLRGFRWRPSKEQGQCPRHTHREARPGLRQRW